MTNATLQAFREIADSMNLQKKDWAICRRINGRLFVQAFGYTRERAEQGAKYYDGGVAVHESQVLQRKA
jgi:hypothetical protein